MSEYTQEDLARDEMAEEVIELLEEVYQGEMQNMYQLLNDVLVEKYGFSFEESNKYIDMWEVQYAKR
jgi:hypothetical protein|tara:strand:+ start:9 stop:209 length:201 start_codon:yes stop_codon:yes gene_type:complete